MFDIGWSEMLVIGVVALIAIGPKELPGVLRSIGQWSAKIRRMAAEFQGQFQEAMREAEMADLKKQVDEFTDTARSFTNDPLNLPGSDKWEAPREPLTWTPTEATPAATTEPVSGASVATPEIEIAPPLPLPDPPRQAGEGNVGASPGPATPAAANSASASTASAGEPQAAVLPGSARA